MSNYTKSTDFASKDSLPSGDSAKIVKGAEFETEFDAISTAIATKADTASPTFTGTVTIPTASVTTFNLGGTEVTATAAELNYVDGVTSAIQTQLDGKATAAQGTLADSAMQDLVDDTTPQLGGDLASNGNDILFVDNDKVIFGTGSELQIYSNGTDSIINESGSGLLKLQGTNLLLEATDSTNYMVLQDGGSVIIYHPDATNAEKFRTTSTGIDVTGTVTSDGVLFGSDTAAANTLDDYEEGDWTPTFSGATTAGAFTYSTQIGKYTKIGRQVIAVCEIQISAITTAAAGNLRIDGLPFNNGGGAKVGALLSQIGGFGASNNPSGGEVSSAGTRVLLKKYSSADPRDGLTAGTDSASLTTTARVRVTVAYNVA